MNLFFELIQVAIGIIGRVEILTFGWMVSAGKSLTS